MSKRSNPLLPPILQSFKIKRTKNGAIPPNWLLIVLKLLDYFRTSEAGLSEDDIYTYDYTLKKSRASAIPKLLEKYGLPKVRLSSEGVTVRGAPGLRIFRAVNGGAVLGTDKVRREDLILEAVELIRKEILKGLGQQPIKLPAHCFNHSGNFVRALLESTKNRSQGQVEQALVGAKLQLRFPNEVIRVIGAFAGDRQTGREADHEVKNLRVIVSVSPKPQHFRAAESLAKVGREVCLVVGEKSYNAARKQMTVDSTATITVATVADYVTANMKEIAQGANLTAAEMCLRLVAEYNKHVAKKHDSSLQVLLPDSPTSQSSLFR
ncbi:MAG: DUF4928 family protein [Gemmataceae bacterium]|nr:DUF4928 family protein [Gemmataceae bacterium]MCI0739494.1 DUF4928 family protein [Gemmataceae bacterium]